MTIEFEIPIRVNVKKNSKRIFRKRNARGFTVLPSAAFEEFKRSFPLFIGPHRDLNIDQPFFFYCDFQMKGKISSDLDGMVTSILDCLQDFGVIKDDKLCVGIFTTKRKGYSDFLAKVKIIEASDCDSSFV